VRNGSYHSNGKANEVENRKALGERKEGDRVTLQRKDNLEAERWN